jgi:Bifunctional DNA primase/polymerase, N-terminal/Primase C terminal 1 (PriCT-1)
VIRHALKLAGKGLKLFPCQPRGKAPCTQHGVLDATSDPERVTAWWSAIPTANIGIATGSASGFFVVDIDSIDAEAELRRLENEHGALPASVESITPRGRHIYFRMPAVAVRNSAGKIAPGIDVRGDGGYVLAPPSMTTRRYAWSVDSASALATGPGWLIERVTSPNGNNGTGPVLPARTDWSTVVAANVNEGQRDSTITRLAGFLLCHRVDPFVTLELLECFNATRCSPPLPPQDIRRIVSSIAGRELRKRQP